MEKSFFGRVLGLVIWLLLLVPAISQVQEVQFDANETTQILCPLIPRSQLSQRVKVTPSPTSPSGDFVYPDESEIFMFRPDGGSLTFFATDPQSLTRGRLQLSFIAINGGGTTFLFIDYAPPGIYPNSSRFEVSSDFKPVAQIYSSESSVQVCDAVSEMRLDDFTARVREDPSCPSISGSRGLVDVMSSGITQEHLVFLGIGNCGSGMGPCSCEGFTRSPNIMLIPEPPTTTTTEFTTTEGTVDTTTKQVDEPTNIAAIVVPVVILGILFIVCLIALSIGLYILFRKRNPKPVHDRNREVENFPNDGGERAQPHMNGDLPHCEENDGGNSERIIVVKPNGKEVYNRIAQALANRLGRTLCTNGFNLSDPSQSVINRVHEGRCLVYVLLDGNKDTLSFELFQTLSTRSINERYMRNIIFVYFSSHKNGVLKTKPLQVRLVTLNNNPEESGFKPDSCAHTIVQEQERNFDPPPTIVQSTPSQNGPPPPYQSYGASVPSLATVSELQRQHPDTAASHSSPALITQLTKEVSSLGAKLKSVESSLSSKLDTAKSDLGHKIDTAQSNLGEQIDTAQSNLGEQIDTAQSETQATLEDIEKDIGDLGDTMEKQRLGNGVDKQEPDKT